MGAPPKRLRPEEKEEDMSKKLFVGSLSWNIDDRGLAPR
jgi:hypothetical protein